MLSRSQPIISGAAATAVLRHGVAVRNLSTKGSIAPAVNKNWGVEIWLDKSAIEHFNGSATQLIKPVRCTGCHFKGCTFVFAYFLQGLIIENCTFANYLDFQAGGHNSPGHPVPIIKSSFAGFVIFFDCWYKGDVFICDNSFSKGATIASKQQLITFEMPPLISGN